MKNLLSNLLIVRRRFFSAVSNHEAGSSSFETRPRGRSSG
jgi:hypothetical protein